MGEPRDKWDKADLILKIVAGLLTPSVIVLAGWWGSSVIDRAQARDQDVRLYSQLMSQREVAETSLRKDMFNSIIGTFLKTKPTGRDYEQQVLNLELLAYNFHEALDLAPLFRDVYTKILENKDDKDKDSRANAYITRLEKVALEVKIKQIAALEESGGKLDATLDLSKLGDEGQTIIDGTISQNSGLTKGSGASPQEFRFKVELVSTDKEKREIRVKLEVRPVQDKDVGTRPEDATFSNFTISPFDFPMINNTRLPRGWRCAIVMRKFEDHIVDLTLVFFPGSRASLKEKPFYDEAMQELLSTRALLNQ